MGVYQGMRLFFGIFMVLVYLGMAVLMAINFFNFNNTPLWSAVRWLFAVVLACYGFYRGYRELTGEHTYGMRRSDDMYDDEQYMTYSERMKRIGQNSKNDENNQ